MSLRVHPSIYGNTISAGPASADVRADRPLPPLDSFSRSAKRAGIYTFLHRNTNYLGFPTPLLETIYYLSIFEAITTDRNYKQPNIINHHGPQYAEILLNQVIKKAIR